jgi:hypothetical protein
MRALKKRHFKRVVKDKHIKELNDDYLSSLKGLAKITNILQKYTEKFPDETPSITRCGKDFYIFLPMAKLGSFKEEKLCNKLEFFLNENPIKTTTTEYPAYKNIDYHFLYGNATVQISAYVSDDSEQCRRILVSETVEEVRRPVYELVCD